MRKRKIEAKPIAGFTATAFFFAMIGMAAAVWAGEGPEAPAPQKVKPKGIEAEEIEAPPQMYPLEPTWRQSYDTAQQWLWAGDVAFVNEQYSTALPYYYLLAKTFPNTPHGQVAVHRGRAALRHMRDPDGKGLPPNEDLFREIYDTLTW